MTSWRVSGELEDVMIEVERSQSLANQAEKRQRNFDKTIDEWKRRVADLQVRDATTCRCVMRPHTGT